MAFARGPNTFPGEPMDSFCRFLVPALACLCVGAQGRVFDIDKEIETQPSLAKQCAVTSAAAVQKTLASMQPGDALVLSRRLPLGDIVVGDVADGIEVLGGYEGSMTVRGSMRDARFYYAGANTDIVIDRGADLTGARFFCSFSGRRFVDESSSTYEAIGLGLAPPMADGAALGKSAVDSRPGASGIVWGVGNISYSNFGSRTVWMPAYYVDGGGSSSETDVPQVLIQNATDGGKWLFAIEAEQGAHCPAVRVQNSNRLQLYSGSTEGDNHETGAVYYLENCTEVVLGMRRLFSNHSGGGWNGLPLMSLAIDGGSGNIIHNLVDIANPKTFSLMSTDPNLQIWQSFFEDPTQIQDGTFQFMVTHEGMINADNTWTEPAMVDKEVVLQRGGVDLVASSSPDVPVPPAFDMQPWMSQGPSLPKRAFDKPHVRAFRADPTFGADLLQAGADPTGRRASDDAFASMLDSRNTITVAPGTYRLARPLALLSNGRNRVVSILGSGRGSTRIVAPTTDRAALDLTPAASLSKVSADCETAATAMVVVDGVTLEGGENGVLVPEGVSVVMSDFAIEGFSKAGIVNATEQINVPAEEGVSCDGDSHCNDMHLYENGSISGGQYGIYYAGFADKQGIRNITFSGHSDAGVFARNTNLFHGWITNCTFENIDGPGVDLSGGLDLTPNYGYYTQWVTMIENCAFIECGSAERAALDYGYTDINMLCNSRITTTGKTIKYGFLGSAAELSNVEINVNASVASLALRNCRGTEASRTPGSILHTVDLKGGDLLLVPGYPAGDGGPSADPASEYQYTTRLYGDAWDGSDTHTGRKWWKDGYEWAFTILVYNSRIAGELKEYLLMNGTGYAKDLITGDTQVPRAAAADIAERSNGPRTVFDLSGRRIVLPAGVGRRHDGRLSQGVYLLRLVDGIEKIQVF